MSSLTAWLTAQRRVLPLEVARTYRDGAAQVALVDIVRSTPCPKCGEGCASCAFVGWIVERKTVSVDVPAGAVQGTRITVEGIGDVVDGRAHALEFEVVARGDRAAELEAAKVDFETKLDTAWEMERTAKGGRRRRRIQLAFGLAVAVFLVLVVRVVGSWALKGSEGAPCDADGSCRSNFCFGRQCIAGCESTRDCPTGQLCLPVGARGACYPR